MKYSTKKKIRGSISVLLVIILLPMLTFSALIVDMSRINMAKQMMSSAGDLTMNTALANYDTILKDVYGLFAMSQQKGMDNKALGEELNQYFAKTLSSYGVVDEKDADDYVKNLIGDFREILANGNIKETNFLELQNIDLEAKKLEKSSLANASIMRKQIVEYMKYRAPLGVGLSFLDAITAFEKVDDQSKVVEAQVAAQESTQDVTKACKELIKLIREYDDRVVEINNALTGVTKSTDGVVIPLEDYDTHVEKYESVWEDANYAHINKLNLVFLANSPSVDSVYLKSLNYQSELYVDVYGVVNSGSAHGINVPVSLAGNTQSAKTQVYNQIDNLNKNYKQYTEKYTGLMLDPELMTRPNGRNNFTNATFSKANEDAAINSFIAFEKFLLDQADNGGLTYSQVKAVLEQIYTLDQYFGNFKIKIGTDISNAKAERDRLQGIYDGYARERNNAYNSMSSWVNKINGKLSGFVSQYENLDEAVAFMNGSVPAGLTSVLDGISGMYGTPRNYYDANLKSGNSDIFLNYFNSLTASFSTKGTATQRTIAAVSSGRAGTAYESSVQYQLSDAEKADDLYKLLVCLNACHNYAENSKATIDPYDKANQKMGEVQPELDAAKERLSNLQSELSGVEKDVKKCQKDYYNFCANYQGDAYYYNHYIQAAKNTIGPEAKTINTHFSQLLSYIDELTEKLNAISEQIDTVKSAIVTYNSNLEKWGKENSTYASNNGSDSFSSQNADDIEKAKTEYDDKLYETLDTFVIAIWNEFDDFRSMLDDEHNFRYGGKGIDEIQSADDLIAAIKGETWNKIVTVEDATSKLATLYQDSPVGTGQGESTEFIPYTMDYVDPPQLGFLSPQILQIQALKYLNANYPEEETGLSAEEQKEVDKKNDATKNEYQDAKKKLTGKDTSSTTGDVSDDVETTGFGYSFESKALKDEATLPSQNKTEKKEAKDEKYVLKADGEDVDAKLDASSGVSQQTSNLNTALAGIGNIATTAVENLYILNYVFENFSYNTIVQEQILKDSDFDKDANLLNQVKEAKELFKDSKKIEEAKKKTTTLSNFAINEKNNYLYGGEVEYILFGNSTPKTNVTSAKASIYAIRFVFNSVYAFTDSEIRNSTMAAGLAVQAATMGIVPYQVVQIVLQLALAAAESAVDLSAMNCGLSVAIVKTRDTWSLSVSNALESAANAAANMVAEKAVNLAQQGIASITTGLNGVLEAGKDELKSALSNLNDDMSKAAKGVLESVVDNVMTSVMAEIENGLNELQYIKLGETDVTTGDVLDAMPTKADVRVEAVALFQNVRSHLHTTVTNACGGNEMALSIAEKLETEVNKMINDMETNVLNKIDLLPESVDSDSVQNTISEFIAKELNTLKRDLIELSNIALHNMRTEIEGRAQEAIDATTAKLQGYISQCGEDLTEEAAEAIRDEVAIFAEDFSKNTLQIGGSTSSPTDVKSSVASMFKFGYKDYLMLLTYISICCGDSVLYRTSDVIQMNLQFADTAKGANFSHKANTKDGSFLMSKAYTYISISATADLDMFFMDLSIFADQVAPDEEALDTETPPEDNNGGKKITYKGLLGY